MGNERFIYIARNKWPGVPIHGKAGNINNALKFNIFAKKPCALRASHACCALPRPATPFHWSVG